MNKKLRALILLTVLSLLTGVVGVSAQDDGNTEVALMSTQFNIIEEAEKFREILADPDSKSNTFRWASSQSLIR